MDLNFFRDEVKDFIDKAGFDEDTIDKIIEMLEDEFAILKASIDDPNKLQHQVYDMLFLLFEIAAKNNMDLDAEWQEGRKRKMKYL